MHFFCEYHIKDVKKFWKQWERALDQIPEDVHFIQAYSSKNQELSIAVWESKNQVALEKFLKQYFEAVSVYQLHEIDDYRSEGEPLKWVG